MVVASGKVCSPMVFRQSNMVHVHVPWPEWEGNNTSSLAQPALFHKKTPTTTTLLVPFKMTPSRPLMWVSLPKLSETDWHEGPASTSATGAYSPASAVKRKTWQGFFFFFLSCVTGVCQHFLNDKDTDAIDWPVSFRNTGLKCGTSRTSIIAPHATRLHHWTWPWMRVSWYQ